MASNLDAKFDSPVKKKKNKASGSSLKVGLTPSEISPSIDGYLTTTKVQEMIQQAVSSHGNTAATASAFQLLQMSTEIVELEQGLGLVNTGTAKVLAILEGDQSVSLSSEQYMNLFTVAFNMCTQNGPNNYAEELYNNYRRVVEEYLMDRVFPSLNEKHDVHLLKELSERWSKHLVMLRWLSRFFGYLDRFFVPRKYLPSLQELGVTCFRELVYFQICGRVKDHILEVISQEREGEKVDRALLNNIMQIFVAIGHGQMLFYENDLEAAVLNSTANYYRNIARNLITEHSFPEYMIMAEQYLKLEHDRASSYLHKDTKPKLMEIVQKELLLSQENELLEKEHSGLHVLLRDGKVEDLKRMYELFHCIDGGLDPIISMFKQHIVSKGKYLVQQSEDAAHKVDNLDSAGQRVFMKRVIELYNEHLGYITTCFNGNNQLCEALREPVEVFCSKMIAGASVAELLAVHADDILKKGGESEKMNEEAVEEALDEIVQLLVCIHDKDLFAEFYRKKLARRFFCDRIANHEHENYILSKLKHQFGCNFTSNMERMMTDMTLATENQVEFAKYLQSNPQENLCFDLVVNVLATGLWPNYKTIDLHLPEEMANAVEVYKRYYSSRTSRRNLTWMFSLGTCTMVGRFDAKPMDLIVAPHQAVLLMLFNTSERLCYTEITEQLQLPDEDVVRLLHSLSCAKHKILLKEPNDRSISRNDIFEFNSRFTDRMRRIKIPLPSADEKKRIQEDVVKDRRFAIDAALVRIMKSRKVMGYQQLLGECLQQLSHAFKPDVKVVKRRIEELIGREYMQRDKDDANVFYYVA
ncbi:cullin-1-like [Phoenix dactylifera]|uniref:Cullin-1-like n=1 Tax=Phoenix dactylifera TaxID=42345 RepID=A0A8B9A052_PHODC|nr:cullin-1-like [Phoenix dactylifera]